MPLRLSEPPTSISIDVTDAAARIGERRVALARRELEVATAVGLAGAASTDALLDAVWPDADLATARNRFKVAVCRLRKRLASHDAVAFDGRRWRLGAHVRLDPLAAEPLPKREGTMTETERFACRNALIALLRGPAPAFAVSTLEPRVAARFATALDRIGAALLDDAFARSDHADAVAVARSLLDDDPCAEHWNEALVRAHVLARNPSAARAAATTYARVARAEFGRAPSLALERLLDDGAGAVS